MVAKTAIAFSCLLCNAPHLLTTLDAVPRERYEAGIPKVCQMQTVVTELCLIPVHKALLMQNRTYGTAGLSHYRQSNAVGVGDSNAHRGEFCVDPSI